MISLTFGLGNEIVIDLPGNLRGHLQEHQGLLVCHHCCSGLVWILLGRRIATYSFWCIH